jgi:hypothetical protein
VITPIRCGRRGKRRLRSASNSPSAAQAPLEFLEAPAQQAFAGLLEMIDHELELAARLVQAHTCPRQHLRPVAHGEADQHVTHAEHGATDLRARVLERQVPVALRPGRDRFETSPSIQTLPSPRSSSIRASAFSRLTVKISLPDGSWLQ